MKYKSSDIEEYRRLIEVLKLLAIPYDEQKMYFPNFVDLPFELSDTYHNAFLLLPSLIENNFFISNNIIANLIRLENMLNSILNNPSFYNLDEKSFLENSEWNNIRQLSREILLQSKETISRPTQGYI